MNREYFDVFFFNSRFFVKNDLKTLFTFFWGKNGEKRENGTNGGEEETWVPFFSYALFPPIRPIQHVSLIIKKNVN